MPEIMRPEWIGPRAIAPDLIEAMLETRWFYQQTAAALGLPDHCPKLRCRRRHACVSYQLAADYCAEPIKLYPACIRNIEAVKLIHASVETIRVKAEEGGDDSDDEVDKAVFAVASDSFRRSRLAAEAAERAAAEKAKIEARSMWWLWKKRK
ncbi:hypothetical protein SAMN05421890_4068 [Ensifer adhaerens]|nr:hypothetical protein SAMN05421890_4068 [Ensifer adhaerens]